MRRFLPVGAALFSLSLVLAACGDDDGGGNGNGDGDVTEENGDATDEDMGGDGDGALSEDEYIDAANEICAEGNEELDALSEDFTPADEDEAIEFIIDELLPLVQDQVDQIRDLDGPEDITEEVNELLDETEQVLEDIADDPEAAFSGDDPFADVAPELTDLGLTECGE